MFEEPFYQWLDDGWRDVAETWIRVAINRLGGEPAGPIEDVRFLPWSAVLRAPTSAGNVYFKACGPSQAHEPALAAFLAAARPDCMIPVLATDLERAWMLMADGGPTLTEVLKNDAAEIAHWSRVLSLQAGVQRELMPRAGELLALGVPDRRPAILPEYYKAILSQPERLLVGEPGALKNAQIVRLLAFTPNVRNVCEELAAVGPPDTFIHDDFHEDHIFARRQNGEWHYTFFDFGDACITHPFVQLVSQPRFANNRFGIAVDSTQQLLREIYLAQWIDFGPLETLDRALSLALVAGCVIRALTWINACGDHLDAIPSDLRDAYASRVAFWLLQIGERIELLYGIRKHL